MTNFLLKLEVLDIYLKLKILFFYKKFKVQKRRCDALQIHFFREIIFYRSFEYNIAGIFIYIKLI